MCPLTSSVTARRGQANNFSRRKIIASEARCRDWVPVRSFRKLILKFGTRVDIDEVDVAEVDVDETKV